MKNIFKIKYYNTTKYFLILFLFITLFIPIFSSLRAEHVETPEGFMSRKKASYKAALEALKAEYRKWCVVAGKPVIPVGPEQGQGRPPEGLGQPPGGFEMVSTPGLGEDFYYEIEQVFNTWSSPDGTNPFYWVDVNGNLFSTSSSSRSSSSSGGDQCSGKSIAFDATAPGGPYAGIVLNGSNQSCRLVGFSYSSESSVWFNALMNNYQYGPGSGWSGTTNTNAAYSETYVKTYSKGTNSVGISFKVMKSTRGGTSYTLTVNSVNW
ncbi:MAG: hypothetical protein EHM12_11620 [Dehalococcoidia bacterium]|nr:MAG: hypothetical protein EHM12_11620 [Dehalococcoidia bacterium]